MLGKWRSWAVVGLAIAIGAGVPGAACGAEPPATLIGKGEAWRYSAGVAGPPPGWIRPEFDDASWKSGPAGFGYGDSDDATILDDMRNRYAAVSIRRAFNLDRPEDVATLYLMVNYDDGFIAYLNGREVASAGVTRTADGLRVDQHEAQGFETFEIRDPRSLLKAGRNVLAIEGHNVSLDSSDFSLDPILATRRLDTLAVADYLADLDELGRRLEGQSSYLTRLGFDHRAALADLRRAVEAGMTPARFAAELRKLVMKVGDCHASVFPGSPPADARFLPVRPADTAEGLAALGIDSGRPLDPACPYFESIDGRPIARWLEAAALYVPRGAPQFVRRRSLDALSELDLLRDELALAGGETVTIGLRSLDGTRHSTKKLRLGDRGHGAARVTTRPSRRLDGNIGYLRIASMDDRLVEPSAAKVREFRDTRGMIIDVRDNSGGTYGVMRGLYGFFAPDDEPRVTNIAAYRLSPEFASDHIEYRPTYRADWPGWTPRERLAIARAAGAFRPEWPPPAGLFSDWHYMILGRDRSGRDGASSEYFSYDRPVVVLGNAGSFSATDGFLNAFAALPGVTLVGEPSGGGSGANRSFALPKTRLVVALSSMASFRPDGRLFDGRGVEVDVEARPSLEDFAGESDSVLAKAVALILDKAR